MDISFVALSITAAASASGRNRVAKENDLSAYVKAAIEFNLPVNDDHHGDSAVELAAYHGLSNVLVLLLESGSPLKKNTSQKNAVHAAVRNGQHSTLDIILSKRRSEARKVVREEAIVTASTGYFFSTLWETIKKCDAISAQLLLSSGCISMSDVDAKFLFNDKRFKRHKKLEKLLQILYPAIPNAMHWQGGLHWSFPNTDRDTLNWLWHVLHHQSNPEIIPDEMWLRVFSFFGRGWFASSRYNSVGSCGAEVTQRNIIE